MVMKANEEAYGRLLRMLVVNLVKNAAEVPGCLRDDAVAFEEGRWQKLGEAEKRQRLAVVAGVVGEGGVVARHFGEYPHMYSKKLFGRFLEALAAYEGGGGE